MVHEIVLADMRFYSKTSIIIAKKHVHFSNHYLNDIYNAFFGGYS